MKKIKIILSIILMALMIIKILSSCSFAMTTEDLEQYIYQSAIAYKINENETSYNSFDPYIALLNSNFWASYKGNLDISNYDSVLVRNYLQNNSYYMVTFNFFNNTNQSMKIDLSGTGSNGIKHGYIRAVNNNSISINRYTFKNLGKTGANYGTFEFVSNDSFYFSNSTSAYETNACPYYYTGNVINTQNIPYYRL